MNIIELQDVVYRRKDKNLLDGITWTVKDGENWVIFGPNGSGKTTLMKILTGYIRPSEGKAFVLKNEIGRTNVNSLRKKIALVSSSLQSLINPQDPAIEIVVAGINAGTRMWQIPTQEQVEQAYKMLKAFDCMDKARTPISLLSQGEQKKVMIARALMLNPSLVVLDEPCEGLDLVARENFLKSLSSITQLENKPGIIFITHHVEEITPIFHSVLFLKSGKVFSQGIMKELMTTPKISELFGQEIKIEKRNDRFSSIYF